MRRSIICDPFPMDDDAATPLTNDERAGLIPAWITYRHELNEVEQANIADGRLWAFRQQRREPLEERFLRDLHKRMLGDVWNWAGHYRKTERNIGVPAWRIAPELRSLLDDSRLWIAQTVFEPDEIAVRFHHRLVSIHPFPNGNGRHSRLMADLLVARLGGVSFTWGGASLNSPSQVRSQYIEALRQADRHDMTTLIKFARS
ncbi:MAG: mobile mystery protein B [Janthinobacterium lividum]